LLGSKIRSGRSAIADYDNSEGWRDAKLSGEREPEFLANFGTIWKNFRPVMIFGATSSFGFQVIAIAQLTSKTSTKRRRKSNFFNGKSNGAVAYLN
jgi:hypothetical protein